MKRRTERGVVWGVVAAAVLGIGAYVADPALRDQLVARDVCDGAVRTSEVDQLTRTATT
ncbi:hypothetical protein [Streptomyces sp. NPDC050264]|uniref:hypothetical protein n=1 Tax=Streptomyces sp. NPDC050264 TaxID=3155038 RepID=UPI00342118D5